MILISLVYRTAMFQFLIYCIFFIFSKTANANNIFELTGVELFQSVLEINTQNYKPKATIPSVEFKKIGTKYYVTSHGQRANWFQAANICRAHNTQLANIENVLEMDLISNYLIGQGRRYAFWISGNDLSKAGHFVWGQTGKPMSYSKWQPGDPNNYDNREHCVSLWNLSDGFYMNDANCHSVFSFICEEKSINYAISSEPLQDANLVQIGAKSYIIHNDEVNWFRAADICRSHGAQLANIESATEMNEMSDYLILNDLSHIFWLSGNDLGTEGNFLWGDTGKIMTYTNWIPDDPNNSNNEEDCVGLRKIDTFQMADINCNTTLRFICVL